MTDVAELPKDWWTTADVAAYLGIEQSTVRRYLSKGFLPKPDRRMGQRVNVWKPRTIINWHESRPRPRKRTH